MRRLPLRLPRRRRSTRSSRHIGWAHVPAERGAIHLDLAGERGVAGLRCDGLKQLVHQHERSLVLDVEIARELNRRYTL
jgi:hypothetical protein